MKILRADPDFFAILKPAGLLTHGNRPGDRSVVSELLAAGESLPDLGDPLRPGVIHRLDRDTAGVLVVARTEFFAEKIRADWENVEKIYRAVVVGAPPERGRIEAPLARARGGTTRRAVAASGKFAATEFWRGAVLAGGKFAEISARLLTGRTHQIRAHFRALGHPIVGDAIYGDRGADGIWKKLGGSPGLRLFAEKISFKNPRTGEAIEILAPVPDDFLLKI